MRRTKEDAQQTREAILDAAEALFFERGVSSTTLSHIATAAGLTRGAIYWHFENKLELFLAMQARARLPQEEFFNEGAQSRSSLDDLFVNTLDALRFLSSDERSRKVLTILLLRCEYVGEMQSAMHRRCDADEAMQQTLVAIFSRAREQGAMRPEWSAENAALAYTSAIGGVIGEWLRLDCAFDLVAVGGGLARSLLAGYAAPDVATCLVQLSRAEETREPTGRAA